MDFLDTLDENRFNPVILVIKTRQKKVSSRSDHRPESAWIWIRANRINTKFSTFQILNVCTFARFDSPTSKLFFAWILYSSQPVLKEFFGLCLKLEISRDICSSMDLFDVGFPKNDFGTILLTEPIKNSLLNVFSGMSSQFYSKRNEIEPLYCPVLY